ncbi:hypothetical protein BRE01_35400 [Brevibacillus reuszeri]|uniref:Uncharacterized protein n=1 Tax=Brevibacillus reuszeri TaxID=54915 RepID=A0A0K9YPQ7_9BACL|nr:hypothetical protein [Brevibacillus reuszeri]KNB70699.1 hypothetical protein ADS79_17625 [Brevibacillus reuszeri]MED1861297.1 hypothetical protein [Brevibacillus reuszeri]GED69838.1 hypothetical protein BRE01_35400 [Brevibacillus reuszeri]
MKKLYFLFFLLIASGCSERSTELESTKALLKEVKQQNAELELQMNKLTKELETKQKEYELRNILDIQAREIFHLMTEGKEIELQPHLSDKLTAANKTMTYFFDNEKITIPFVKNGYDFRQRFYSLESERSFITGYEVWQSGGNYAGVLVLKFVLKDDIWVLDEIQNDI